MTPEGELVATEFSRQVRGGIDNLGVALAAAAVSFADVVQANAYVVDLDPERAETVHEMFRVTWGATPRPIRSWG